MQWGVTIDLQTVPVVWEFSVCEVCMCVWQGWGEGGNEGGMRWG